MKIGAKVPKFVIARIIHCLTDSAPQFAARPRVVNVVNLGHTCWRIPLYKFLIHFLTRTPNFFIVSAANKSDHHQI